MKGKEQVIKIIKEINQFIKTEDFNDISKLRVEVGKVSDDYKEVVGYNLFDNPHYEIKEQISDYSEMKTKEFQIMIIRLGIDLIENYAPEMEDLRNDFQKLHERMVNIKNGE